MFVLQIKHVFYKGPPVFFANPGVSACMLSGPELGGSIELKGTYEDYHKVFDHTDLQTTENSLECVLWIPTTIQLDPLLHIEHQIVRNCITFRLLVITKQ